MSIEQKNVVRAIVADMAKEGRKTHSLSFKLAVALYELTIAGDIPANWADGWKAVREEFLPETPGKDDKANKSAFAATMMLYRRAAAVGIALGKLRPNANPFGMKSHVVQLPAVISGKELEETFSVTKAGELCQKWMSDKKPEPVDQIKSAMLKLTKLLNDVESISDAAFGEYDNLVSALMVHKNRRTASKPQLIKATK
jgi:hypothetical protein